MILSWWVQDYCHECWSERWLLFRSGLAIFSDPALEERFQAKQVQAVSRFFATAFFLQVLVTVLSVVRSFGDWTSTPRVVFSGVYAWMIPLVRSFLLLIACIILRREGRRCRSPRLLLFVSAVVLAVVLTTFMIDDPVEEATRQATRPTSAGHSLSTCESSSDTMACRGSWENDADSHTGKALGARVLLIHWFLGLSGLFSCLPVRCFASSLLPVLMVVLCTTTQTFEWWVWLLSALTALLASARAERQNRFLFLVTASLQCEQIDRIGKLPPPHKDAKHGIDLGLEAASNLLLTRLWQNAQLQSAAHELFDAVVSVDVSPERDGKTRFAEVPEQELQRLASLLVDDSCSDSDGLRELQGSCLEDFLLPDASENWRSYVKRRRSERELELDAGEKGSDCSRPSASSVVSTVRLQLAGGRRKELLGLLSPPASPGSLALLCLRSVPQESSSSSPRSFASVDCGIFGGGVFGSGTVTNTPSEQASPPHHSDCSSCDNDDNVQVMDCLPPTACVWAQGAATPTPLSDVKLGMKVLTVDPQRSPSINFDPVKKISFVSEEPSAYGDGDNQMDRWLRIGLSDGSEVMTTAAHPMWPEGTYVSSGYTLGALKAEDLVPGVDSLVSLSARRVIVKHVTTIPKEAAPAGRVSLELGWDAPPKECGDAKSRRALFLTLPQEEQNPSHGGCWIGVGDSSVKPAANRFDALEEQEGDTASLTVSTRSSTSHPSTAFGTEVVYGENRRSSAEDVEIILGNIDESSGWRRDRASGEWVRCPEADVIREVKLSDIRNLPKNAEGEPLSYGSIGHALKTESCKVCVFNRKNGVACRNGWSCTFCHAWHQPYVRPRRPDKRRGPRAASSVDGDEFVDGRDTRADPGLGLISEEAPPQEPWYVNMPAPPGGPSGGPQPKSAIVSGRFTA